MRSWARGAVALGSLGLWLVACTEHLVVRPEGEFSWEPASRMVWPVQGAVLSAFGDAARPGHQGIDLAARGSDPVAAAMLGRVEYVGDIPGYGKVIVLSHADRLSTVYAHLGAEQVRVGDAVSRGQTIATAGKEGYIHYEVRDAKQAVDPAKYYSIAPQPLVASSAEAQQKVSREPAGVGALTGVDEGAPPPPPPTLRPAPSTPLPTRPPTPLPTPFPTATPYPTLTPTPFPTATPYPTSTPTPLPTATPYPTLTPTPFPTATPYPTTVPPSTPTLAPAPPPPKGRAAGTPALRKQSLGPARTSRRPVVPTPTPEPPPPPPAPPPSPAPESGAGTSQSSLSGLGLALELVGANLFYVPAKLAYAGVGAVTGAFALVLAHDTGVAQDVWRPALGGDYFVTADHLRGDAPLRFAGDG